MRSLRTRPAGAELTVVCDDAGAAYDLTPLTATSTAFLADRGVERTDWEVSLAVVIGRIERISSTASTSVRSGVR